MAAPSPALPTNMPPAQLESGPQEDYKDALARFHHFVKKQCQPGVDARGTNDGYPNKADYLPFADLRRYFSGRDTLKSILQVLWSYNGPNPVGLQSIQRNYNRTFAILLHIGKGTWIQYFIEHPTFSDPILPLKARPDEWPAKSDFWDAFYDAQWMFCAPDLHYNRRFKWEQRRILPIYLDERLGSGASGTTYRIKVHPSHNSLHTERERPSDAKHPLRNVFVLKTFRNDRERTQFDNEVTNFVAVRGGLRGRPDSNIIGFYGSYEHGPTFNILLEYANLGTLEDFLGNVAPPTLPSEKLAFWKGFLGLIEALYSVQNLKYRDSKFMIWHQDIKPKNILVTKANDGSSYDCKFKLADLGLAHTYQRTSTEMKGWDNPGTRTYGAPELYRPDEAAYSGFLPVTSKADVWSLGAVLSRTVAWYLRGYRYVEEYDRGRIEEAMTEDKGCFHDGYDVLQYVQDVHDALRTQAYECQDHIATQIIDIVRDMLMPEEERPEPGLLWRKVRLIHERARNANVGLAGTSSQDLSQLYSQRPFSDADLDRVDLHADAQIFRPSRVSTNTSQEYPEPNQSLFEHSPEPPRMDFSQQRNQQLSYRTKPSPSIVPSQIGIPQVEEPPVSPCDPERAFAPNVSPNGVLTTAHHLLPISGHHSLHKFPHWSVHDATIWRDRRRKKYKDPAPSEDRMVRLNDRDHVFLVDDSSSMDPHWPDVMNAIDILAYTVKGKDKDGVDLHFTVSSKRLTERHTTRLVEEVKRHRPPKTGRNSDVFDRLDEILRRHQTDLRASPDTGQRHRLSIGPSRAVRKMNVYILTDGVWRPHAEAVSAVETLIATLDELRSPKDQVGIVFIQFGDDPAGTAKLEELDTLGLVKGIRDIIDREPWKDGNVLKMLLGGVDPEADADIPPPASPISPGHQGNTPAELSVSRK